MGNLRNGNLTTVSVLYLFFIGSFLSLPPHGCHAWVIPSSTTIGLTTSKATTTTRLSAARRSKKGTLGTLAKEGFQLSSPSSRRTSSSSSSTSKSTSKKNTNKPGTTTSDNSGISPALAEWMKNNPVGDQQEAGTPTTTTTTGSSLTDSGTTFQVFSNDDEDETTTTISSSTMKKENSNPRRMKQSQRSQMEMEYSMKIRTAVESMKDVLEGNNNIQEILKAVNTLFQLSDVTSVSSSPRVLFQGSGKTRQRFDYRLAWVGSDTAICHVGTGLHKTPLARLQEVFFSILSGNTKGGRRIELLEVIRILGPFPNVRNTLQGTTTIETIASSDQSYVNLQINMDRMIDGTGKEIAAGTEDNIRRVPLRIYLADENVILAVVPPSNGGSSNNDPMEGQGSNVLVFLKEDSLSERMDSLRVS